MRTRFWSSNKFYDTLGVCMILGNFRKQLSIIIVELPDLEIAIKDLLPIVTL